jgi:hypothetical protein
MKALTELRIAGHAPKLVWIVVGDVPRFVDLGVDVIRIAPTDKPSQMDLRALVMLDVTMFEIGKHGALFNQAIHAVEAAKPAALSLACRKGVVGVSDDHEHIINKVWRVLQCH